MKYENYTIGVKNIVMNQGSRRPRFSSTIQPVVQHLNNSTVSLMQSTICAVLEPIPYVFFDWTFGSSKMSLLNKMISINFRIIWCGLRWALRTLLSFEFWISRKNDFESFRRAIWFYIIDSDLFLFERTLFEIIKGPIKNY